MGTDIPEYKLIGPSEVFAHVNEGRCGRIEVCVGEGRQVVADYWATEHRLEIDIDGQRLVCGATSWCMAVQWGCEYQQGLEASRAAIEVARHLLAT